MRSSALALLISIIAMLLLACDAARLPALSLRGGAKKRKTVHLHDIARNDSRNEYFAGGQDEEGRGSATVLIYPDEPDADSNETDAKEEPEPPKEKFQGTGRKL